jgi:hypothetical protein
MKVVTWVKLDTQSVQKIFVTDEDEVHRLCAIDESNLTDYISQNEPIQPYSIPIYIATYAQAWFGQETFDFTGPCGIASSIAPSVNAGRTLMEYGSLPPPLSLCSGGKSSSMWTFKHHLLCNIESIRINGTHPHLHNLSSSLFPAFLQLHTLIAI